MTTTPPPDTRTTPPLRRYRTPLAVLAVLAVAAAAAVWFLFLRDDSPDAFDIDDATAQLDEQTGSTGSIASAADLSGTWVIGGPADAEVATSEAGYRVDEELASIGATTAVGRTEDVNGSLTIESPTLTAVEVTVDMSTVTSDDSRRDNRMRSALATDEFPTAVFVLTEPVDLGDDLDEGAALGLTVDGEMTIKGVTNRVSVTLDARLSGETLVVVGSVPVVFSDYGVDAPTSPIALSVDNNGVVEFQLLFTRA